jgi:hypothetical protein
MEPEASTPMLDLLLNHSPAFLGGELMLALSLGLFGVAWAGTLRERYAVRIPARANKRSSPPLTGPRPVRRGDPRPHA